MQNFCLSYPLLLLSNIKLKVVHSILAHVALLFNSFLGLPIILILATHGIVCRSQNDKVQAANSH